MNEKINNLEKNIKQANEELYINKGKEMQNLLRIQVDQWSHLWKR